MNNNIHTILYLILVVTLSSISSSIYLYVFKKIRKEKARETLYVMLFFITNTIILLINSLNNISYFEKLFALPDVVGFVKSALYILSGFALRQVILLRSNIYVEPLYKNKWLYGSIVIVFGFFGYYLFNHRQDFMFGRVMVTYLLIMWLLCSALFIAFKNRIGNLEKADKFLIFMVLLIVFTTVLVPIVLYKIKLFALYNTLFLYSQILHISLWTMTFIIVFMLDMIKIQYISSITDNLTGLFNRKHFFQYVNKQIEQTSSNHTVVFVDIDHFKNINDSYGHDAGDKVIKEVSRYIEKNIDKNDLVARFGGEEFAIFFANKEQENVRRLAESLRKSVENFTIEYGSEKIKVTISVGIARLSTHMLLHDVLKQADSALYEAKRSGRNQVRVFQN